MGRERVSIVGSLIFILLRSKLGVTVEVSKACYGSLGLQCTRHILECSSGRIAIQEAFYMIRSDCGRGVSNCVNTNLTDIHLTGTRYNFSDTEVDALFGKCSTQTSCSLPAGRSIHAWISTIIYRCMDAVEVSKACYGQKGLPCTTHSLRCSSGRIAIQEAFYVESNACGVLSVSDCANVSLNSIPLTGKRYNFSDEEIDSLRGECSAQSTCSLRETSLKTTTPKTTVSTRRQGTTAKPTGLTTSRLFPVIPPDKTTLTHIGTGVTRTVATLSAISGTETKNGMGGMFASGLFTGLAIAAFVVGVVYFFYIRRRCVLKKPDPGPASPNHPTYTGLTDLCRPDTYDVINIPEAVTRPSEASQAPVYHNVNNVS